MFCNTIESIKFVLSNQDSACFQWPALIGYTGAGKTTTVKRVADEMNLKVKVLLLGTMLPEDILGLPKATTKETHWTVPDWARDCIDEPHLIFMDELDKANPSCLSAVLTLMTDLRIRNIKLHPDTKIIVAMQPVDETFLADQTGEAICARVVFFPIPYENACTYLAGKHNVDDSALKELFKDAPEISIPRLDRPSPRQIDAAFNFIDIATRSVESEFDPFNPASERQLKDAVFAAVAPVLHGMMRNELAIKVFNIKMQDFKFASVSPTRVVRAICNNPGILNKLPDSAIFPAMREALFGRVEVDRVLGAEPDEDYKRISQALVFFGAVVAGQLRSRDSFNAAVENLYEHCKALVDAGHTSVEIFGDATPEDVIAISAAAAKASERNPNITANISRDTVSKISDDFGPVYSRAMTFFSKVFDYVERTDEGGE